MLLFFAALFVCVVVNEALVELINKSVFFSFLRVFLSDKEGPLYKFFSKIVECPFCCSVWTSLFLTFLLFSFSSLVLINSLIPDFFIFWLFVFRASNYFHDWHDKKIDKHFTLGVSNEHDSTQ